MPQPEIAPISVLNIIIMVLFSLCFLYQAVFCIVGLLSNKNTLPPAKKLHRYAYFIAAHNEASVIANLVASIKAQKLSRRAHRRVLWWPDACTDNTAEAARQAGAIVYERNDLARKGKSWVMDYGFKRILKEYPNRYEGLLHLRCRQPRFARLHAHS